MATPLDARATTRTTARPHPPRGLTTRANGGTRDVCEQTNERTSLWFGRYLLYTYASSERESERESMPRSSEPPQRTPF